MDTVDPLVSIVIGTFDRWDYLRTAIQSALGQTYQTIEIIVCDDGGPPQVKEVVETFTDPRLRYYRNARNVGIAANHRSGLAASQGKYIAFLNDDDAWCPEFLAELVPCLETHASSVVAFCDHYIIDSTGAIDDEATEANTRLYKRDTLKPGLHRPYWVLALLDGTIPDAMATLFRREAFVVEDFEVESGCYYCFFLSYLVCRNGGSAFYVPRRLTKYRWHNRMETGKGGLEMAKAAVFCYTRFAADPRLASIRRQLRHKLIESRASLGLRLLRLYDAKASLGHLFYAAARLPSLKNVFGLALASILRILPKPVNTYILHFINKIAPGTPYGSSPSFRVWFRDSLAWLTRELPPIPGKARIGARLAAFLTNFSSSAESVVTFTMRDNSIMRLDLRSRTEEWSFWTGEYDAEVIKALGKMLTCGAVVLDIGANVGFYTIPLGRMLKDGGGEVHAFEPVPSNYARLRDTIALNQLGDIVQAYNVALGDHDGVVEICMEDTNGASTGNAVLLPKHPIRDSMSNGDNTNLDRKFTERASSASVTMTTLDSLAKSRHWERCDLIKLDVEGAEIMCLRGGINFIREHRPIIFGEFNAHWMRKFGHSFADVLDLLMPLGYSILQLRKDKTFAEVAASYEGMENVLLFPIPSAD